MLGSGYDHKFAIVWPVLRLISVPYSRTQLQSNAVGEARIRNLSISSQAFYHCATALLIMLS